MIGGAGSLLAVLFAAAALSNNEPPLISGPFAEGPTKLHVAPPSSAPFLRSGDFSVSQPLAPGVYQTRPDTILLIVPKRGLDDRIVVGADGSGSKMPIVKPPLQAVPIPSLK